MPAWNGLPGVRTPRSFIEPLQQVDASAAYGAAADAIGFVAGQVRKVVQPILNQQAEEAGARSVTRDAEGNLVVGSRFEFGEEDAVYNNAAEASYLSSLNLDFRQAFLDMRQDPALMMDPDAFRNAAEGYLEGKMESLPSAFRGAARGVFNQEVARNMGDIVEKKEAAAFARQKSAVESSLTMMENDVFAYAMQGALGSPEGQQALADFDAGLGMLRNPMWGVSDEEIQLRRESTLSLAKGYAAKGAVVGVYNRGGYDAAEAAIKSFVSNPDLQLTPGQRNALESDMMQEIRGLEMDRRSAAAAAEAQATAGLAYIESDIDVMVGNYANFGQGDYATIAKTIETQFQMGRLKPGARSSALNKLGAAAASNMKKQEEKAAVINEFTVRQAGVGWDAGDPDQRKVAEVGWDAMMAGKSFEEQLAAAPGWVRTNGIVPPQIAAALKPGIFTGSPEKRAATALAVMRLHDASPRAVDQAFDTKEIEEAQIIADGITGGSDPAAAIEVADLNARITPQEQTARKAAVSGMFAVGNMDGTGVGAERAYAQSILTGDQFGIDLLAETERNGAVVNRALADYQAAFDASFAIRNNVSVARRAAEKALRTKYGPTRWGASPTDIDAGGITVKGGGPAKPRLQLYSPETQYSAGLSADEVFPRQVEELKGILSMSAEIPWEFGMKSWDEIGEKMFLQPVDTGLPDGSIGFYVVSKETGKYVMGSDGEALVYQPDTAWAAKRKAEKDAADRAEIQAGLARLDNPLGFGGDDEFISDPRKIYTFKPAGK